MNQTKIGNRVVVIGSTAPANQKTGYRKPTKQRRTTHRIVVIRNGKLVGTDQGAKGEDDHYDGVAAV
jgi:hypothetical protein